MMSLSLFFLVVILVFNIYPGSLISLRKGEQRAQAARLAQSALNEFRGRSFADLLLDSQASYQQDFEGTNYTWKVQVRRVPDADVDKLKALQVSVQWQERGQPRHLEEEVWVSRVGH